MKPRQQAQKRTSQLPGAPRVRWVMALAGLAGLIGAGLLHTAQPPAQAAPMLGPSLALHSNNGLLDASLVKRSVRAFAPHTGCAPCHQEGLGRVTTGERR